MANLWPRIVLLCCSHFVCFGLVFKVETIGGGGPEIQREHGNWTHKDLISKPDSNWQLSFSFYSLKKDINSPMALFWNLNTGNIAQCLKYKCFYPHQWFPFDRSNTFLFLQSVTVADEGSDSLLKDRPLYSSIMLHSPLPHLLPCVPHRTAEL